MPKNTSKIKPVLSIDNTEGLILLVFYYSILLWYFTGIFTIVTKKASKTIVPKVARVCFFLKYEGFHIEIL